MHTPAKGQHTDESKQTEARTVELVVGQKRRAARALPVEVCVREE